MTTSLPGSPLQLPRAPYLPTNYYSQSAFLHYSVASLAMHGLALALGLYESSKEDEDSL
ncbi:MAG: hypothetical protein R3D26_23440 [Cyanobacteriota/Melainabacteria group bacterium]